MTIEILYILLIAGAGGALLARAASGTPNRLGWALIGAGLCAWALGDAYYLAFVDPELGPYPSVADGLYVAFYVLALVGLRLVGGGSGRAAISLPLITAVLGLATLWAWLVFGAVLGSTEGSTAAVAMTLAYPFMDLLLLGSVLIAVAASGWSPRGSLLALLAGIAATGTADLIYVGQIASGSVGSPSILDAVWPLGAILIAAAAWMPEPGPRAVPDSAGRLVPLSAALAMLIALLVLVWDHYERASVASVILAALTLATAAAQLVALHRGNAAFERRQRTLQGLYSASAQAALDCIVAVNGQAEVVEWNRASARTFGYRREEALGRSVTDLIAPRQNGGSDGNGQINLERFDDPSILGRRVERIARRADGSELPIELAVTRIAADPPLFTGFIRDISVTKKRNEERERLAAMVRSTEEAMFSVSLDGIVRAWNPAAEQLYGYSVDEALGKPLLDRLVPGECEGQAKEMLRQVSRGESVSCESIRRCKDGRLIDVALRYFPIRDEMLLVTGCAVVGRDITDRRRREAERRRDLERRSWQDQIEDALETDGLEFHAQPVWNLSSHKLSHHELLMRMRMRIRDTLAQPGEFLPHAEDSPLMRRLDNWAIRRGISMARHGRVAINLSATSLAQAGLVATVQDALDLNEVDPSNVMFEITETAAAENLDDARVLVAALTQIGCGFALDDFGTGFNSFTYLKYLPVTELKIDIQFIRGLAENQADQQVVRSIVAVAENFELGTIAEGVEDEATLELLTEMGIDCAQGFLLGRPSADWAQRLDLSVSSDTP